jgi:hypothetical protein
MIGREGTTMKGEITPLTRHMDMPDKSWALRLGGPRLMCGRRIADWRTGSGADNAAGFSKLAPSRGQLQ